MVEVKKETETDLVKQISVMGDANKAEGEGKFIVQQPHLYSEIFLEYGATIAKTDSSGNTTWPKVYSGCSCFTDDISKLDNFRILRHYLRHDLIRLVSKIFGNRSKPEPGPVVKSGSTRNMAYPMRRLTLLVGNTVPVGNFETVRFSIGWDAMTDNFDFEKSKIEEWLFTLAEAETKSIVLNSQAGAFNIPGWLSEA